MGHPLAIYLGTKYVVRDYDPDRAGLWAILGPIYARTEAQHLADSLNQEREGQKRGKNEAKTNAKADIQRTCETPS